MRRYGISRCRLDELLRRRSEGVKKRPTVGRRCDLLWVASETYCRFFRRPTVGRFLGVQVEVKKEGCLLRRNPSVFLASVQGLRAPVFYPRKGGALRGLRLGFSRILRILVDEKRDQVPLRGCPMIRRVLEEMRHGSSRMPSLGAPAGMLLVHQPLEVGA